MAPDLPGSRSETARRSATRPLARFAGLDGAGRRAEKNWGGQDGSRREKRPGSLPALCSGFAFGARGGAVQLIRLAQPGLLGPPGPPKLKPPALLNDCRNSGELSLLTGLPAGRRRYNVPCPAAFSPRRGMLGAWRISESPLRRANS